MPKQLSINEFCEHFNIKKTELATAVGITKQQLNGWAQSNPPYLVQYSDGSDELVIVKPSKPLKEGRIHGFDNISAELPEDEEEAAEPQEEEPDAEVVEEEIADSEYTEEDIAGMSWLEKKEKGLI